MMEGEGAWCRGGGGITGRMKWGKLKFWGDICALWAKGVGGGEWIQK